MTESEKYDIFRRLRVLPKRVIYVDSVNGNDQNEGTNRNAALKSIQGVNSYPGKPGDVFLFRKSQQFFGKLITNNDTSYSSYGAGALPIFHNSVNITDWVKESENIFYSKEPLVADVGTIIFDEKKVKVAVKKWAKEDLKNENDFFYCKQTKKVYLFSKKNPALNNECKALLSIDNIFAENKHNVLIQEIESSYGAWKGVRIQHGSSNISVNNCRFRWIGGGELVNKVRQGNAVETWGSVKNIYVRNNTAEQIYDDAFTNQWTNANADRVAFIENCIWENNISIKSSNGFNFFNRPYTGTFKNIIVRNNTVIGAGYEWGNAQRPDPGMAYGIRIAGIGSNSSMLIENNLFKDAKEAFVRMWFDEKNVTWKNNFYTGKYGVFSEIGNKKNMANTIY
jgi:hypothetical protein